MLINLEDPIQRKTLIDQIQKDIDAYCKWKFTEDPRTHLGASIIGHDCKAYAWNTFRWLKFEEFDGRMRRLFNRGHLEESRFVDWLTGIGFEVHEIDPETKKQFRITGSKGHFGGSLDAVMKPPVRYNLPDLVFLGEFKTHNEKSFTKLKAKKVQVAKPQHYRQMASYGAAYGFGWGLYCAVNKNDDELYFEIVELKGGDAQDLYRKADDVIFSQTQPQKIARSITYFDCKYCDFAGICHSGETPDKNCRSCIRATPIEQGEWYCKLHSSVIPKQVIPLGCESWMRII